MISPFGKDSKFQVVVSRTDFDVVVSDADFECLWIVNRRVVVDTLEVTFVPSACFWRTQEENDTLTYSICQLFAGYHSPKSTAFATIHVMKNPFKRKTYEPSFVPTLFPRYEALEEYVGMVAADYVRSLHNTATSHRELDTALAVEKEFVWQEYLDRAYLRKPQ